MRGDTFSYAKKYSDERTWRISRVAGAGGSGRWMSGLSRFYRFVGFASPAGISCKCQPTPLTIQSSAAQLPVSAALGGAFWTLTSGNAKYFGTLFVDSRDNIPAVNGCTYEVSMPSTSQLSIRWRDGRCCRCDDPPVRSNWRPPLNFEIRNNLGPR